MILISVIFDLKVWYFLNQHLIFLEIRPPKIERLLFFLAKKIDHKP